MKVLSCPRMGISQKILELLAKSKKGASATEVAKELSRHSSTVYLTMERLRLYGCLTRGKESTGIGRAVYVYRISEYGKRRLSWLRKNVKGAKMSSTKKDRGTS